MAESLDDRQSPAGGPDALPEAVGVTERGISALRRELGDLHNQQRATAAILRVIAGSPADFDSVLAAIAESAARLCEATDALIFQLDGPALRRVAAYGSLPRGRAEIPATRRSVTGRVAVDRQILHLTNIGPEFVSDFPESLFTSIGVRAALAAPLLRDGSPRGVILIRRLEARPFTEGQVSLLQTFADQAVIAIENARLFRELNERTSQLVELNHTLERRIREQVEELERVGRLRRFLSPALAELIVSSRDESILASHRRQITVLFCDLRGFTAFAETADPEEVMGVLSEYHATLGGLIHHFEGTIERFAGDGLMVFFNDPLPQPDHAARAVRLAVAMRDRVADLTGHWRRQGHELDFGVGIAMGYATLGRIGFERRFDYAAIGPVTNLAARLCGEAAGGQILITGRVHGVVGDIVQVDRVGELVLKGFHRPVAAFNVSGLRTAEASA